MFQPIFEKQIAHFRTQATKPQKARLEALDQVRDFLLQTQEELLEALSKDLGKSPTEAYLTEFLPTFEELRHTRRHLATWMKPKRTKGTPLMPFGRFRVQPEPKGQVLIVSPFNYPLQLSMVPLIAALAAGNTVILKLSEQCPHTTEVMTRHLKDRFPEELLYVTGVSPQDFEDLFDLPYDHIFFTGSTRIGRKVMAQASPHLTTLTLELGGKSPVILHPSADLTQAARKIVWGKFLNAGQTCIAPDYILAEASILEKLILELKKAIEGMYPIGLEDPGYGKIINPAQFHRLKGYLKEGTLLHGGRTDEGRHQIEPTLILSPSLDSDLMKEEIFGPILPILPWRDESQIHSIIAGNPEPLALYIFAKDKDFIRRLTDTLPFGGGAINDVVSHILSPVAPFGGRGPSGMGRYHGKHGFDAFSHPKTLLYASSFFDLPMKYPPYKDSLLPFIKKWMER